MSATRGNGAPIGYCFHCSYPLTPGGWAACPECGHAFDLANERSYRTHRRRVTPLLVAAACGLVLGISISLGAPFVGLVLDTTDLTLRDWGIVSATLSASIASFGAGVAVLARQRRPIVQATLVGACCLAGLWLPTGISLVTPTATSWLRGAPAALHGGC